MAYKLAIKDKKIPTLKLMIEDLFKSADVKEDMNYKFQIYARNEAVKDWSFINLSGSLNEIKDNLLKELKKYGTTFFIDRIHLYEDLTSTHTKQ